MMHWIKSLSVPASGRSLDRARGRAGLWLVVLLAATLAGCAAPPVPSLSSVATATQSTQEVTMPEPSRTSTPTNSPAPQPSSTRTPPMPAAGVPEGLLETAARQDLARRLNITPAEVQIVRSDKTEMPAGSLGCGESSGSENTGLIIGYELALSAGNQEYVYRSDGRRLVPCSPISFPGGRQPVYLSGAQPQPTAGSTIQAGAVADLAGRLGIAPAAITGRAIEPVAWPDASLGCAKPGMMYAQVVTPGYRIVLEANGKTYEYHTGQGQAVLCR